MSFRCQACGSLWPANYCPACDRVLSTPVPPLIHIQLSEVVWARAIWASGIVGASALSARARQLMV